MSAIARILSPVTANRFAQRALEKTVKLCLQCMGVGTGAGVWSSGERAMITSALNDAGDRPCIFDVGANKGQFLSLLTEVLKHRDADIHAFEPSSCAFGTVSEMFRSDRRVHLNQMALAREVGKATLHSDEPGSGMASLTDRRLEHRNIQISHHETVNVDSIDHYCEANSIAQIDLLKIDVEGHELDVLAGGERMLKKGGIAAVAFEFGGCNIDTRTFFQDFYYLFKDLNMSLYRIGPGGYACPVDQYREIYEQFRTTNFFARRAA